MIQRRQILASLKKRIQSNAIVGVLGPRQCGKTTLVKQLAYDHYFDLEKPEDLAKFENPQFLLQSLQGTIIIDEIQRRPELFPILRYLADQKLKQKYIILGSASRDLIQQSSESLAGRISYLSLAGLTLEEVTAKAVKKIWMRGGFPRSFTAKTEMESTQWRKDYITTFLERDIPQLGISIPAQTLRRFWMMLSHYHGQVLNYSEIGRSFGISDVTVKHYIDILVGTFMVRLLFPWHNNLGKRLVKSPKLYLRDSGLFHTLQTISNDQELLSHPKLGASWEGFALEQLLLVLGLNPEEVFFWGTHAGAELDLFWKMRGKNWGVEFKYTEAPKTTKSMHIALENLKLEHLWVIYPGKDSFPLDKKISVLPLNKLNKKSLQFPADTY